MEKMNTQTRFLRFNFMKKAMGIWFLLMAVFISVPMSAEAQACDNEIMVTSVADDGPGTLRQAILDVCDGGRIYFSTTTYGKTIILEDELIIDKDMNIDGPGMDELAISGDDTTRVFQIMEGVEARIEDLTIKNGIASLYHNTYNGLDRGAGIWNKGALTLKDSRIIDHRVDYGEGGAGIYSEGEMARLYVIDCEFTGNRTYREPYGPPGSAIMNVLGKTYVWDSEIYGNASGALFNKDGYMLLERTIVSGNSANWGGGLRNEKGRMEIRFTTFSENGATGDCHNCSGSGGAILNYSGEITIENSAIVHNGSGGSGRGGGYGGGIDNGGEMYLFNTTVSNNYAGGGINSGGGGIRNEGELYIEFSTISENIASGYYSDGGGILGGTVYMSNSILSGNLVPPPEIGERTNDGSTTIISSGYNLIGDDTGIDIEPNDGDQIGSGDSPIDAKLEALMDNGGLTMTHALMEESPAVNAANPLASMEQDQRGEERPKGGRADIGAFESGFGPVPTEIAVSSFTLVNAADDTDVSALSDGDIINLFVVGNLLTIRANTDPEQVGSVGFELNGERIRVENNAPYALAGDSGGDYFDWTPDVGLYTLTATPYDESGGNGNSGNALTIQFEVINEEPSECVSPFVSELLWINSLSDTVLMPVEEVDTLRLYEGTSFVAMEAVVDNCDMRVGSVVFEVNGTAVQTEHAFPYAISGDNAGDFRAWDVTPGVYQITATPYSEANGQGTAGESLTVEVVVIDAIARMGRDDWKEVAIYPNPTNTHVKIQSSSGETIRLNLLSLDGQLIQQKEIILHGTHIFELSHLSPGIYFLELMKDDEKIVRKIVKY